MNSIIENRIKADGFANITVSKIQQHVNSSHPNKRYFGKRTIWEALHKNFGLKFRKFNQKGQKYEDVEFEERRIWVSRLLGAFTMEETLIISIDESSFREGSNVQKQWQFFNDKPRP